VVVGKSSDTNKPTNVGKLAWLWKKVKWLRKNDMSRYDVWQKKTHTQIQMGSIVQVSCSTKNVEEIPKFMMNLKMEVKLGQFFKICP